MRTGVWAPIPMWVGGTRKWAYRDGVKPRAIVIHRMEGSLEGSDSYLRREFADYSPYPRLSASTHFGVGLWYGTPQIRQWVDTSYSAFGWASSPTDIPDALAKRLFGDLLYSKSTWPYWQSRRDLNRDVISIEVEGFAYQAWESRTAGLVKDLINRIVKAHGPLTIATHTCLSSKACPGMSTFQDAMPGYYGAKIGAPASAPTPGGLPVNFRFRAGWKAEIIKGKPRRSGPTIASTNFGSTTRDEPMGPIFEVVGEDLGKYGLPGGTRWFFTPQYISKWRWAFVPLVDLKNRNF